MSDIELNQAVRQIGTVTVGQTNRVPQSKFQGEGMAKKPSDTLSGVVHKILYFPNKSERIEIANEGPDLLHEEVRIENGLTDSSSQEAQTETGAKVKITIKAEPESIPSRADR
jgi:hypothetical protein